MKAMHFNNRVNVNLNEVGNYDIIKMNKVHFNEK